MSSDSKALQEGVTGTCQTSDSSDYMVTVSGYTTVSSESDMASYVGATGPLSVCLDASTWSSYTGGILKVCGSSVDHCVQAVGVDTGSDGYWKGACCVCAWLCVAPIFCKIRSLAAACGIF